VTVIGVHQRLQPRGVAAFHQALAAVWRLIGHLNKYVDDMAPWALYKDAQQHPRLKTVMFTLFEGIRHISQMVYPFMPETAQKIRRQLALPPIDETTSRREKDAVWGLMQHETRIEKASPLFPRIDV
jgi:methionyl-tRNA synthetase